ncbi:Histone-lysine N-methyltransferase SETD2 [Schistosoma japonicum]|uniref:Histone-lysine N-methyltransferase SETD2 n=1 Tax=Schistosoma japonicum TaxID=6182 RepID=A0A4Z2CLM6_SCHJA|nr:Histone-lysine N-methyltransferase SETD2 [Schistosoma japonicum]
MEYDPASPTEELEDCSPSLDLSAIPLPRPLHSTASKGDSDVCNIPLPPTVGIEASDIPLPNLHLTVENAEGKGSQFCPNLSFNPKSDATESLGPLKFSMRKSAKSLSGPDIPTESSGVFESSKDVKVEEPKAMPKLQAMMKRSKPFQLPVGVLPAKNKLPASEVKTDLFLPTKESETLSSTSDHNKGLQSHPHSVPSSDPSDQIPGSIVSVGHLVPSAIVDKAVVLSSNIGNKAYVPGTNLTLKTSPIPNLMSLNLQPLHHSVPIVATRNLIHAHATDPTLVQASIPPTAGMQFVNPQKFRSAQMIATPLIANPAVANQFQQNEEAPKGKNGRRRSRSHSHKYPRSHKRSRSRRSSGHRHPRRRHSSSSSNSAHRFSRTRHRSRSYQNSKERHHSSTDHGHSKTSRKHYIDHKRKSEAAENVGRRGLDRKKFSASHKKTDYKDQHCIEETKKSSHYSGTPDKKKKLCDVEVHSPYVRKSKSSTKNSNDRPFTKNPTHKVVCDGKQEPNSVQYVQTQKLTSRIPGTLEDVYRKTQPKMGYRQLPEDTDDDDVSNISPNSSSNSENQSPVIRNLTPLEHEESSNSSPMESDSSQHRSNHSFGDAKRQHSEVTKSERQVSNIKTQKRTSQSLHPSKSMNIDEIPLPSSPNNASSCVETQSADSYYMELESGAELGTLCPHNEIDDVQSRHGGELVTANDVFESTTVPDPFFRASSEPSSTELSSQHLDFQGVRKMCEVTEGTQSVKGLAALDIQCSKVVEPINATPLAVVSPQDTKPCESKYDLRKRKIKPHIPIYFFSNTLNPYERFPDYDANLSSIFSSYPEAPTPQYTHLLNNDYSLLGSTHSSAPYKSTCSGSGKLLGTSGLRANSLHYEMRQWICDCAAPTPDELSEGLLSCGPGCINRALNIECGPHCAAGNFCSNRQFQLRLYAPTKPFYAGKDKGWGLMTTDNVEKGSFIIEYVGEVIDFAEFRRRIRRYERLGHAHHYFMAVESDRFIDAGSKGNWARFVNHSCEPNCVTQKWSVDGEIRIGFFAREDIPSGQEVTIDYQFVQYGVSEQKCYCGTPTCSGVMGATNKYLQEKVRMKDTTMVERRILQLLQLESFRNADDITLLLQVMVQECLTRYTRLELLNRLIKTEHDACLKLFRQYNGLDMLAAFMYDAAPKDWELKKQILVCLKHIPVSEQKQVQSNSHLMEIVAQWTRNPQHCRRRGIFSEPWKCADADTTNVSLVRLSTVELPKKSNFDSDETKLVSKGTKDNKSSPVKTGDKNSDFAASPSSSDSFSSLKENTSCILHSSILPIYDEGCNNFISVAQISDCDISPGALVDNDTGEIEIVYTAENNELNVDIELLEDKSNDEWIEEIKALACELFEKWSKLPKENYRIPRLERQETEKMLHISNPVGSSLISWGSECKDEQLMPMSWTQKTTSKFQFNKTLRDKLASSSIQERNGLNPSNSSSCLSKAERRMLFEAQVKASEKQCSSENPVPASSDSVQTNPSNDEKDIDHFRQLLLCALLSECGQKDTALSNLLSDTTEELKTMPVVSTLLQALPRMLSLLSSSNDSDLVARLCEELKRYAEDDLSSLPAGWKSAADSNGRLYYYNKETNSVQWEKPLTDVKKTILTEEQYEQTKRQFTHEVSQPLFCLKFSTSKPILLHIS